jgi:hypothetical protein
VARLDEPVELSVIDRSLRSPVWLFSVGVALAYFATLTGVFVQETERPSPTVVGVFAVSALAGIAIGRLWVVLVPLGVAAASLVLVGVVEEDVPLVALIGGLLVGLVVARTYAAPSLSKDSPARRWSLAKRVLRPVVNKSTFETVDDLLDGLRFRIDTLPNGLYQPVPGVPARAARATGSESRWLAMLPVIERIGSRNAVDIGACEGYFSLQLGAAGIQTIAVENEPSNYRTTLLAAKRTGADNVGVLALEVTPENAFTLPAADCVLCLSVWHHFVRSHGFDSATGMLGEIWELTRRVMFFDTGEEEMTPDYGLPAMAPDARSWLAAYLSGTCPGAVIEHLGSHRAFAPGGAPCERNLFAVIRA